MTTTREESEMTRAPEGPKCEPWCGLSYRNGKVPVGALLRVGMVSATDPAFCSAACRDARLPPIQPPEPETWRGMRVGQRLDNHWGTIRLITRATPNEIDTRTEGSNLVQHWRRSHPGDRSSVESWTLVSDAGEARSITDVAKAIKYPAAVPAKVEPAKVLRCDYALVEGCQGTVLERAAKGMSVKLCTTHYLEREQLIAEKTPHTEPKKSRPPRYPESNDIDADIPDSWAR